ncbi:low temperature requirement protein A [Microbacterium elymi]|uniref:Low temperature requirement protein A n=1 Tax=Microbacterium elymi TaxID=2909587 RepID=A0ABY5NK03_9MICO|nr:low temperature requirement protein A [Microbacterium elymi]UUT35411.1 low temperature requirement protein A [Microbacterium elymi]
MSTPAAVGRRVHWVELLFDLVLVTAVGQIARGLHGAPGPAQFAAAAALLAAVWWAWINASLTMNLFGARVTPLIWVCVGLAMAAVGLMAAAAPDAFGARAAGFAIGNAAIRLVWMVPWLLGRRKVRVPWWRPVVYCALPAAIWLASIPLPAPVRTGLWLLAIAVEIALLARIGARGGTMVDQLDLDHIIERVTLVVVIAFGEVLLSVIVTLGAHWAPRPLVAAGLGFAATVVLAWTFFAHVPESVERGLHRLAQQGRIGRLRDAVMYLPFLLIAGLVMLSAGIGTAIADSAAVLPLGAVICLAAGVSLLALASAAESLRYGAPWRDVAPWAPLGMVLPWVMVAVGSFWTAVPVLVTLLVVVVAYAVLVAVNARLVRVRRAEPRARR